jgi:hypothetical protein
MCRWRNRNTALNYLCTSAVDMVDACSSTFDFENKQSKFEENLMYQILMPEDPERSVWRHVI